MAKRILIPVLLLLFGYSTWAATEPIAPFTRLTGSSRQSSMGGAYTAVHGQADAVTINPAGLYGIKGINGYATYYSLFEGFSYIGGFAGKDFSFGTLGFNMVYFSSGSEEGTVLDGSGNLVKSGETLSSAGTTFAATYAHSFFWNMPIGITAKLIQENFSSPAFTTFAADVGVQKLFYKKRLFFGASVTNLGLGKERADGSGITDQLPLTIRGGAGAIVFRRRNHDVMLLTDVSYSRADPVGVHLGIEYNVFKHIFLRAGYEPNALAEKFSFGGGLQYRYKQTELAFDYALRTHTDFGSSNKFTLKAIYGFGHVEQTKPRKSGVPKTKVKFGLASVPLSWDQVLRKVSAGSEDYVRVITRDGSEHVGQLNSVLPDELELATADGPVTIQKSNVVIMFAVLDEK